MLATLGLTLGALFTPGWSRVTDEYGNVVNAVSHPEGLFAFLCGSNSGKISDCQQWFDNLPDWEKAVVVMMCVAAGLEVIAILWTLFTICACCCKKYIIHPLPALAFLMALFLAASVIVFGVYNQEIVKQSFKGQYHTKLGYSFYLAIGGLAGAVVDIIVGALTVALAEKSL